ncbi:hypothetical protein EV383_4660 [Pseudonocardia sediminis]|uniref:DUF6457 domain-containing protein n=1 Tax=Pseudonocardia sediminis TaxID=1397368 RepID=A0A4Q7V2M9_PSEST|nr:DUF6457 domain-containing protein [Pseudonocardia sediminis]RZT87734.1 hypothetical protein EV383_4660 [Pseudonocardia sediminis]
MSDDAAAMTPWVQAVTKELGLHDVDTVAAVDTILDLTSDVAHSVSRPGAPVTAFLLGIAAGRADEPDEAVKELSTRLSDLAENWDG